VVCCSSLTVLCVQLDKLECRLIFDRLLTSSRMRLKHETRYVNSYRESKKSTRLASRTCSRPYSRVLTDLCLGDYRPATVQPRLIEDKLSRQPTASLAFGSDGRSTLCRICSPCGASTVHRV
jgi:hypothetical protein